jgi:hypothetical protein
MAPKEYSITIKKGGEKGGEKGHTETGFLYSNV